MSNNKLKESIKWSVFALSVVIFGLLIWNLYSDNLGGFDTTVYHAVRKLHSPVMTSFFRLATWCATLLPLGAVALSLLFLFRQKHYWISIILNLAFTGFLNLSLKQIFLRIRPEEVEHLVTESGYSFPSGHSMVAAAFYGFIIYVLWHTGLKKQYKIAGSVALIFLICCVGLSRIYLGAHYASDVIGGFAVSTAYLIVFTSFVGSYFQDGEKELNRRDGRKLYLSFRHAYDGLGEAFATERNFILHVAAMALVILFGVTLRISLIEWCICIILIGMVIATELINTAIECTVDLAMPKLHPKAKRAKDTAAGAVLICVIVSVVAGTIIFFPKLWDLVIDLL